MAQFSPSLSKRQYDFVSQQLGLAISIQTLSCWTVWQPLAQDNQSHEQAGGSPWYYVGCEG